MCQFAEFERIEHFLELVLISLKQIDFRLLHFDLFFYSVVLHDEAKHCSVLFESSTRQNVPITMSNTDLLS
jgi:hypothetical protein